MKSRLATVQEIGARRLSNDELTIINFVKMRLSKLGWTVVFDRYDEEARIFENLIPLPDTTFSVIAPETGEHRAVALHFSESEEGVRYVCTMQLANGDHVQEGGRLKNGAKEVTLLTTSEEWQGPIHVRRETAIRN
jgi:hypothetical protein